MIMVLYFMKRWKKKNNRAAFRKSLHVSALGDRRFIYSVSAYICERQLPAAAVAPRKATAVTHFVLTIIDEKWWEG